ncbi:MAG: hypothetical protein IPP29_01185 [Bacteroidetes bacterium]|nr:hypothetical protein [Bacteroidota bacterium]
MGFKFTNKLFINIVVLGIMSIAATLRRDDFTHTQIAADNIAWLQGTWMHLSDDGRVYAQFSKDKNDVLNGMVFTLTENGDTNLTTKYKINFKRRNFLMQCIDYRNQTSNITNYQMVHGNNNKILFEFKNETDIKLLEMRHTNNNAMVVMKTDSYSQNKNEETFIKLKN